MPLVALILVSDEGFKYQRYSDEGRVRHEGFLHWSEIVSVHAYKRDFFTYDLICIAIQGHPKSEPFEIDEEDLHWNELMEALSKHLPGIQPWGAWFSEVAFPAFAPNLRQIYRRAG